jgi:hypothetical protein
VQLQSALVTQKLIHLCLQTVSAANEVIWLLHTLLLAAVVRVLCVATYWCSNNLIVHTTYTSAQSCTRNAVLQQRPIAADPYRRRVLENVWCNNAYRSGYHTASHTSAPHLINVHLLPQSVYYTLDAMCLQCARVFLSTLMEFMQTSSKCHYAIVQKVT